MNIRDAWAYGRIQLKQSPSPELDARLLLEHLLAVPHSYLITHEEQPLTSEQSTQFKLLIARAELNEPLPHIIGRASFFDFELTVSPDVLIPRPETEQLVTQILNWLKTHHNTNVLDVGTGSGCIPIALARKCSNCMVTAVDVSTKALTIAKTNAARLVPNRIQFKQSNLLSAISDPFDLIVANLPYVTEAEWTQLDDGVKLHEPALALIGGRDGLDLIKRLLQQAQTRLNPNGAIFLEIGWQQGTAVKQLGETIFPNATVTVHQDFAGHDRIVMIE